MEHEQSFVISLNFRGYFGNCLSQFLLKKNVFIQYRYGPKLIPFFEMSSRFMASLCSLMAHQRELIQSAEMNRFNQLSHSRLI